MAVEAAKHADNVVAADIDKEAVEFCRQNIKIKNIGFIHSDLFSNIKQKFDLIIFNPPYLPEDKRDKDIALDGGKKGYEIIEKFIKQAKNYLKEDGKILIVFSSLTNKEKIDSLIKEKGFKANLLSSKKLFFEKLFTYLISME